MYLILMNRLFIHHTNPLDEIEVAFMSFLCNFKFYFLSTLFIGNINKNEKPTSI
jgi:hypothetical protein